MRAYTRRYADGQIALHLGRRPGLHQRKGGIVRGPCLGSVHPTPAGAWWALDNIRFGGVRPERHDAASVEEALRELKKIAFRRLRKRRWRDQKTMWARWDRMARKATMLQRGRHDVHTLVSQSAWYREEHGE